LKPPRHETRIYLLTLASGAPAVGLATLLLWRGDFSNATAGTLTTAIVVVWFGFAHFVRERVMRPLQTAANLLSALREEDFSFRARSPRRDDALGELMHEANTLGQTLRTQRLGAQEASALVRTVMTELDVAVFTFDDRERVQFANRAAERLLTRTPEELIGRTGRDLGLGEFFEGDSIRTLSLSFPGGSGKYGVRRSSFRQNGRPHQMLVLTDLSRALRDEERAAWQRIVRVIGHEMNNSLAPIKSIAGTMGSMLAKTPRPDDWEADLQSGLTIIASRAGSLSRFLEAYSRLARLPPPKRETVRVADWIQRVAGLETRLKVETAAGPDISLTADGDQLDQLLINLVRNGTDAVLEAGGLGQVLLRWEKVGDRLEVRVQDEGPGLAGSANLFVPFFTTKPGGSGIGLALCRQIADAHDGGLTLENRADRTGCVARLSLPLA
jgi:two-component system, NtrC family, nitrogen regulation sensor histidine kinase NtrY